MARALDRNDPAQATAILNELVPDEGRRALPTAPSATVDRDEAIRLTLTEPDVRRERRAEAIDAARRRIEAKQPHLDEFDLRRVLELFNQDVVDGRNRRDRFKTGLVGNNANLLVSQLPEVNRAISTLWDCDDTWIAGNLTKLRASGAMPGGGWLFPTMILHTRRPDYYMPLTESMVEGLAALDGRPAVSLRTGQGYLEYCERLRALFGEHGISPHFADILLWNAQRKRGADKGQEPDEPVPQHVAVTAPPPASQPAAAAAPPPAPQPVVAAAPPPASPPVAATVPAQPAPPPTRQPVVTATTPVASSPFLPNGSATTRGSIGWLHLTDLHAGMQGTGWLWPNVLATVFDDLGRLHDQCGPWDLVLFTGDLTQRGSPEEFAELDRTFERLWRRFEQLGSRPRLIAVPGNHDLQRPKYAHDPVPLALSRWHERRDLRNYVVSNADNPYILELRKYFAAYTEWAARAPWFVRDGVTRGIMPGDIAASLSLHGIDIGVVGLNSTFLQLTGDDYRERLDVHPRQLEVCGDYAPEWLQRHHINLLLTHHPPEWLEPRARQEFRHEIDAPGRFAAHFYGHMHEGTATATRHGGGPTRHAIQGASLFGLEEYDDPPGRRVARIHGYTAGRFEPANESGPLEALRVRIFPRKMLTGVSGRRIAPDHSEYELDDRNSFTFQIPTVRRS